MTHSKSPVSDLERSVNPYEPPSIRHEAAEANTIDADAQYSRVQKISSALFNVNIAVFLYLCLVPLNMLFVSEGEKFRYDVLPLVAIPLLIFGYGAFTVYQLVVLLRGKTVATVSAIGLLVPLFGFLALLFVRQMGYSELQKGRSEAV